MQMDDGPDPGEWRSPKKRRNRNRAPFRGPSESQSTKERTQALEVVSRQSPDHNPFQVLNLEEGLATGTDGSDTVCSLAEGETMPLLILRLVDDLG